MNDTSFKVYTTLLLEHVNNSFTQESIAGKLNTVHSNDKSKVDVHNCHLKILHFVSFSAFGPWIGFMEGTLL